jgi:hypothetical protein
MPLATMPEPEPRKKPSAQETIRVPLRGPNIVSSLESPPPPAAVKVHQAVVRKHLLERKTQPDR